MRIQRQIRIGKQGTTGREAKKRVEEFTPQRNTKKGGKGGSKKREKKRKKEVEKLEREKNLILEVAESGNATRDRKKNFKGPGEIDLQ